MTSAYLCPLHADLVKQIKISENISRQTDGEYNKHMLWHALWQLDGPTPPELGKNLRELGGGPHLYNPGNECLSYGYHRIGNNNCVVQKGAGWRAYALNVPIGPFSVNRKFVQGLKNTPGPSYAPDSQDVINGVWVSKTDATTLVPWSGFPDNVPAVPAVPL